MATMTLRGLNDLALCKQHGLAYFVLMRKCKNMVVDNSCCSLNYTKESILCDIHWFCMMKK